MNITSIHSNNIFSHFTRGTLANKTSEAQATSADAVIVTEGPAVLAGHQGLDVAAHGARDPVLGRGLGQQRHAGGLEHHLVALVVSRGLGGGGGLHSDHRGLGGEEDLACAGLRTLEEVLALITERTLLS